MIRSWLRAALGVGIPAIWIVWQPFDGRHPRCRVVSCVASCRVVSRRVASRRVAQRCVVSCRGASCRVASCRVVSHFIFCKATLVILIGATKPAVHVLQLFEHTHAGPEIYPEPRPNNLEL
eukprot:11223960-Lingulodinium_polyedra.AAC.1